MFKYYKLRCDLSDGEKYYEVINLLKKQSNQFIGCYEVVKTPDGDNNPHCHFLLKTVVKQATLRHHYRNIVGSGNRNYSLKECDEEFPLEYIAYILKEGDVYQHNFPKDVLDKARVLDKKIKDEIKMRKERKKTVYKQLNDVIKGSLVDEYTIKNSKGEEVFITKEYIVDIVIDYYKDREKENLVREFQVVSLVKSLCLRYVPSYDIEFRNYILEKI